MATPALVSPLRPATASLATDAALSRIAGVLDRVDHDGRKGLTGAARLELVRQARALAGRVEALAVTLVAEADAHAASMATTGTPTTSWLTLDRPTTAKEAAGLVFAGVDTTRYESVKDAALAGEVAVSQARAIAKSMGELPATLTDGQRDQAVGLFLQRGAGLPAGRIKKLAPAILAEVAPEAVPSVGEQLDGLDAQRARAFRRRGLSFTPDGDGSVLIKGCLPELEAQSLLQMVTAQVETDRRAGRDHAADRPEDIRSGDQRRADALITLIGLWGATHPGPQVAGDRPRVVVTLRETDLRERAEQAGILPAGSQITAGDLRRLCCDADLTPVVLGTDSEILDVGRTHRLVTPAIRRALTLRDGGCTFPGCQTPNEQCDAHHIIPWWDGGTTSLSNLVLLCPHHHGLVEPPRFFTGPPPDRWEVRLTPNGRPEFLPPQRRDPHRTPLPGNANTGLDPGVP